MSSMAVNNDANGENVRPPARSVRRGAGRPPGEGWLWQGEPLTADLMTLAASPLGTQDADFLAAYPELARADLVKAALRRSGGDHRQAMQIAYRYLENEADPAHLQPAEVAAFGLAVGVEQPGPAAARRERAARALGKRNATGYVRASRKGTGELKISAESELMRKIGRALQLDDGTIRVSYTRETVRTTWPPEAPPAEELRALCGTWRGITATTNMVKALHNKSGPHETYMVVRQEEDGSFSVRWLFQGERDVPAAAVAFARMEGGLRMTCVYEVDVTYMPRLPDLVHHRGTCLLDRSEQDPGLFSGRYYTDAGTSGVLDFDAHVTEPAEDVLEAQYLFRHTSVNGRRVAALQQAVERGLNDSALRRLLPRVAPLRAAHERGTLNRPS